MAVLFTASTQDRPKPATERLKRPDKGITRRKGMLQRLGLLKLAWWRVRDDIFAITERIEKAKVKQERLIAAGEQDSDEFNDAFAYQLSLENRKEELLRRRDRISSILTRRVLDSLPDEEYQWWRRMEPVAIRRPITGRNEYWFGTTKASSVGYERIAKPKLDKNKALMWRLNPGFYFDLEGLPEAAKDREWSYNPLCTMDDVEIDVWGMPYTLGGIK